MEKTLTMPVDEKRLAEFTRILQKYKAGKASIERRTVAAENWWKLRNSAEERKKPRGHGRLSGRVRLAAQCDRLQARGRDGRLP